MWGRPSTASGYSARSASMEMSRPSAAMAATIFSLRAIRSVRTHSSTGRRAGDAGSIK